MLTSQARETLRDVEAVIVDEIHALAATKRGAHLALSLERLDDVCRRARRSASACRPPSARSTRSPASSAGRTTTAAAAAGHHRRRRRAQGARRRGRRPGRGHGRRSGEVIDEPVSGPAAAGPGAAVDLAGDAPAPARAGRGAPLHAHLRQRPPPGRAAGHPAQRARGTRATTAAADERRAARCPPTDRELVKAHHGSLSRERRLQIEDELKSGRLRGLVCTSSLELGIDMGAVDLVVQVESPGAVAPGLQRIGRAGHQVGEPSRGKLFPKHRADLVEAAVVVAAHARRADRAHPLPPQPARRARPADRRHVRARRVDGRRARRARAAGGQLRRAVRRGARRGARPARRAATRPRSSPSCGPASCGTGSTASSGAGPARSGWPSPAAAPSPTAGLFGVFLPDGTRVGELDEEMVYESPAGRDVPARRLDLAHRGHHLRPGRRHPGARASRARCRSGTATGPAGRSSWAGPSASSSASPRRAGRRRRRPAAATDHGLDELGGRQPRAVPRRAGRGHRRRCPTTARSSSSASATRSATGGLRALAVRRPGARPVGHGAPGPPGRAVGPRRRADVERRRHRAAPARGGRRAARSTSCSSTPTRSTSS